jgi:hypothetical protein
MGVLYEIATGQIKPDTTEKMTVESYSNVTIFSSGIF